MANIVNSGAGANISAEVTVTQGNNNTTVIDAAYKAARDFVDKPWAEPAPQAWSDAPVLFRKGRLATPMPAFLIIFSSLCPAPRTRLCRRKRWSTRGHCINEGYFCDPCLRANAPDNLY